MKTFWKIARRISKTVLALGLLMVLVILEENWRGHRVWTEYRHELEAAGFRFGIDEIRGPAIPDAQNFASLPLLRPAFDFMRNSETGRYQLKDLAARDRLTPTSEELRKWRKPINWQTGQIEVLAPSAAAEILQHLRPYADSMAILAQAARDRPLARYPLPYEEGVSMPLSHLSVFQTAASAFNLRADAELALAQNNEAWADIQTSPETK